MRFLRGFSAHVGINLELVPQIAGSDPYFTQSMLIPLIQKMLIYQDLMSAEYCPIVDSSHYSDASDFDDVKGFMEKQVYTVEDDIRKFSHPIAAAISYLGDGYPSPKQGDNGCLHIESGAHVRRRTPKFHTELETVWYDLPLVGLNSGPSYHIPVYAIVGPGGTVLSPTYTYNCFGGGGSLLDNVRRWDETVTSSFVLPFTIGGPPVCTIGYWGAFWFHGLELITITNHDGGVTLRWTEWFSNYLTQRFRKLECRLSLTYGLTKSTFNFSDYLWYPYDMRISWESKATWYDWGTPGSGDIYSTLRFSESFVSSGYQDVLPRCVPLSSLGEGVGAIDISPIFRDAMHTLALCRDGVATSTTSLLDTIRLMSSNWIEFAGEFSELFSLLPLELHKEFSGYFARSSSTSFIAGLKGVVKGISALYIFGRFSISPTVQSGKDIVSLCEHLVNRLDAFGEGHVRSGRKLLRPSQDLFVGTTVRPDKVYVVSACNFGVPYSGDLPGVLAADTYGALPLPSRFWDLAPWSWAVDYFTRYQDRIEAVEAIIMLSIWRARGFTHSVSFDLSRDDFQGLLDVYNLEIVGSADSTLRCYMREVSALVPFNSLRQNFALVDTERRPDWTILLAIALCFAL